LQSEKNMATFKNSEIGEITLIQGTESGRIIQIGLSTEQHKLLQMFLAEISKESPLIQMGEEYDLVLKSEIT
jgi:hypothetical protein